jgi:hypothetical protein
LPLTLSLNDTQLVSTLVFLIAGLIQLDQGITVYHFSIVVNLAWMASATQLVGFMVMILWVQKVGQGSKIPHPYLPMRIMRSVLITTEFALLARVSYIQGNQDWDDSYGCPVRCLSENVRDIGGPPSQWMVANFVLLAWTLIDSIALLFKRTREQLKGLYVDIKGALINRELLLRGLETLNMMVSTIYCLAAYACVIMRLLLIVYSSITFNVTVEIGWFILGAVFLFQDRRWARGYFAEKGESLEDQWGFGQIFPLAMLTLPILVTIQAYGDLDLKKKASEEI